MKKTIKKEIERAVLATSVATVATTLAVIALDVPKEVETPMINIGGVAVLIGGCAAASAVSKK